MHLPLHDAIWSYTYSIVTMANYNFYDKWRPGGPIVREETEIVIEKKRWQLISQ